jgi:hypothetical protein
MDKSEIKKELTEKFIKNVTEQIHERIETELGLLKERFALSQDEALKLYAQTIDHVIGDLKGRIEWMKDSLEHEENLNRYWE